MARRTAWLCCCVATLVSVEAVADDAVFVNSVGLRMRRVEPGKFTMGCLNPTPFAQLKPGFDRLEYLPDGDWDEHPPHEVTIRQAFWMAETEVTVEAFRLFRPEYEGGAGAVYADAINWQTATLFCEWLSAREGRSYRLPTEAEWEYACRAGTTSRFSSGNALPEDDAPNPWGLRNLHRPPLEWCRDWHGLYPQASQMDPVGPATGVAKVLRGGGLDHPATPYYRRSANRAGYAPDFPDAGQAGSAAVRMPTGIRLVMAPNPSTEPWGDEPPFVHQCVSQRTDIARRRPGERPYFRKRRLHPVPPENLPKGERRRAMLAVGLHPALLDHQHSPGMTVLDNGDVLAVYYSSDHENEGGDEVSLIGSRLRFGAEEWDMPEPFVDFPDANDHAPLLWNDGGKLHLFWGNIGLGGAMPFNWWSSNDHGATFGPVRFPQIVGKVGGFDRQPVNSAFRDSSGAMYVASDAGGTLLWVSRDDGATWQDTGGRTGARHTTFALLGDGRILGLGGKSAAIDGTNPRSVSDDGGKTWQISASVFAPNGSNQRPSLIRLASGRLLFAADFQDKWGNAPAWNQRRGAHLAYSDDDGETWVVKRLPGAQGHEQAHVFARSKASTIGYSVLRQAPNGLVHLITSVTHPDLHFVFNEAWLVSAAGQVEDPAPLPPFAHGAITKPERFEERDAEGALRAVWSGGFTPDGHFLLNGPKTHYRADGRKQWEVTYRRGRKVGTETYWGVDGKKLWSWEHGSDGVSVWTHWHSNGQKRSESSWRDFQCERVATRWNPEGDVVDRMTFHEGMAVGVRPETPMTGVEYLSAQPADEGRPLINSLGMRLVPVPAGTFQRGFEGGWLPEEMLAFESAGYADWLLKLHPRLEFRGERTGLVGVAFAEANLRGEAVAGRDLRVVVGGDIDLTSFVPGRATRSVRWRGVLRVPTNGEVVFRLDTDLKARLLLDERLVVDGWEGTAREGRVTLGANEPIVVVLEHVLPPDLERLGLFWRLPGAEETLVPAAALSHLADQYNAAVHEYAWVDEGSRARRYLAGGDYDEGPRHEVRISEPFRIAETEVTIEQFRRFRPAYEGSEEIHWPYAAAVSWHDAIAFCEWLSETEGKPYRLPTEAEWEYACRAGTETLFSSGGSRPSPETANAWGIKNMHTGVREWCHDLYAPYAGHAQTDPVGADSGWLRVIRGGGLDVMSHDLRRNYYGRDMMPLVPGDADYYARSANRAAMPPSFGPPPPAYRGAVFAEGLVDGLAEGLVTERPAADSLSPHHPRILTFGRHGIGFRVVQAPPLETAPRPQPKPWVMRCVKQTTRDVAHGLDPARPHFRARRILPELDTETVVRVGWKIGLPPGLGSNQHTSALAALPNGDLLAVYYNGFAEKDPDLSILSVRLRSGADCWDVPSVWPDLIDANDASTILWNDQGTVHLFWGGIHLGGAYPFQWTSSSDSGATWGPIRFPRFAGRPGGHRRRQPSASAFRDEDGTMFVGFDGWGGTSGLWKSLDDGATWLDAGGRTSGLHSVFVPLGGTRLLAIGTRNRHIDRFAIRNVSKDLGKTWDVSRSSLPYQGGGRRPFLIRLASGRLFYASDFSDARDPRVTGFSGPGAYVGLSEDEGESWRLRKLEAGGVLKDDGAPAEVRTLGYVSAAQAVDGRIHLVTSRNTPKLHFEVNESWILADTNTTGSKPVDVDAATVQTFRETYPNGRERVVWSAGRTGDGLYRLHGKETWFHPNGQKEWEVVYANGRKTGTETYRDAAGVRLWERVYDDDGTHDWTLWEQDGTVRAHSRWRGLTLLGPR